MCPLPGNIPQRNSDLFQLRWPCWAADLTDGVLQLVGDSDVWTGTAHSPWPVRLTEKFRLRSPPFWRMFMKSRPD